MGLASDKIQQVLLTESDLTFEKAVSMATARETALKDVQAMASGSVHYVPYARNMSNVPKTPCSGCGKLHWKRDCPFKNASCHLCIQKGHLKKMCYTSKSKTTPSKCIVNFTDCNELPTESSVVYCYEYIYAISENVRDEPIMVDVTLDSVRVPMEMDTGALLVL
ncbi:uncharacterized protein LOC143023154 [Oratosquilla oratoria]|uniref:uncharacterized protein LOC143023154 n=1 Tax=Oratosquilla oratoria TaxID=337810 RepID=UPI003F757A52